MEQHGEGNSVKELSWRGFFIVLISITTNILEGGVYKSFGVLLPTLKEQFTTYTWVIGIVASLGTSVSAVTSILAVPLEMKFGVRKVLIVSCLAVGVGLFLCSIVTNPLQVALAVGFVTGPGLGVLSVICPVLAGRHYTKHFAKVCGVFHSGSALGFLVFAPLTQLFLDTYGWRGTMLLIAAICCHSIPCAALIKDSKKEYESVTDRDVDQQPNQGTKTSSWKDFVVDLCRKADAGILLKYRYWIVFACRTGVAFPYCSWVIYFVPHLQSKGFSPEVAAWLCSVAAIGYFVGTLIWGPPLDRGYVGCSTAVIISSLVTSLSFVVDPWIHGVIGNAIQSIVCCLSISSTYTLTDVLTKELFGVDRLVTAFAWIRTLVAAPILLAGFFAGSMFDTFGNYDVAFIIIGCVPIVALLPLVIGKLKKII